MGHGQIELDQRWGIRISLVHARSVGQAALLEMLSGDGADGYSGAV